MRLFSVAARLLLGVFFVAFPMSSLADEGPLVATTDGPVAGFHAGGVIQFRGIPYAAPPVGELRWQPPQQPARWTSTLEAVNFGDTCIQNGASLFSRPSLTENCLFLNVYTPATFKSKTKRRPVMVWFYGGALTGGESDDYDGSKLARMGDAVIVTVNYRLGYLGYFALPALDKEGHAFGNYGLMDQQFALKWVQRNIARFGGDPRLVTIFGQSGGGTAVLTHLVSPISNGLFQRLINESGTHITATPLADAEKIGSATAAKAGCAQAADVMKCMRALTPLQLLSLGQAPYNFVVQDGTLITGDPYEQFKTGQFNHVPIVNGLVQDEQAFFLPEISGSGAPPLTAAGFNDFVTSFGASNAPAITAAYPLASYASPSLAEIAVAQGSKACIARTFDREWSQYTPVYAYQFNDETVPSYFPPVSYPTRAFHTSELLYLFPLFRGGQGSAHRLNAAQEHLSDQLVAYWTAFARTGDPNTGALPRWSRYAAASDDIMALALGSPRMTSGYGSQTYRNNMKNNCDLWDTMPLTGARG